MKNKILFVIITIFSLNSCAQTEIKEYKAFNESFTISINNDSIAVSALIAKGEGDKETVILLHGLPGNEKNLDLAENIRQNGKNVIYFNYRGSWGSQGEFLYSNCLIDITKVIDFISEEQNANKYRVQKENITLIGHSLGSGIAIIQGIKDNRVKKIVALSTFNAGDELKSIESINELTGFKQYLTEQFMLNINAEKFLTEIIINKIIWNLGNLTATTNKSILFIDENDRNEKWINQYQNKNYKIIKSDHSFSDKRKELSDEVIKWLNKN